MFSIIGESNVRTFTKESNFKQVYHYACLSTDNKPTTGISNGSTCFVMNSGKTYIFDEENGEWVEVEGSGGGGGGGGGDYSAVTVTIAGEQPSVNMVLPNEEVGLVYQEGVEAGVYEAPTYKGKTLIQLNTVAPESVTVSGDCTKQGEFVFVSGDCTITFS